MTVIGVDDTDSRTGGMCTTYVASRIAAAIEARGYGVDRTVLVRLNPAVEYKTRGNAALAIHTELPADKARDIGQSHLDLAVTDDDRTNPGLVVANGDPGEIPPDVVDFARQAVRGHCSLERAHALIDEHGFEGDSRGTGRGRIGALAAVGAWQALDEWTYELLSYRKAERWGTPRELDEATIFSAADRHYPAVWDTVDVEEEVPVCVPRTPCPILHGIRGEDPKTVRAVAHAIDGEAIQDRLLVVTNQGTDAHLQDGQLAGLNDGYSYRVDATVSTPPETREGGHVFLTVEDGNVTRPVAAFEPTKRFREHVRALRVGDRLTLCGEIAEETLKLEKFCLRQPITTERVTPTCQSCDSRMESAGRNQGYRCRDCDTSADAKVTVELHRELEPGWYEVPPCARRHIARPLVRGGFDAPVHPER